MQNLKLWRAKTILDRSIYTVHNGNGLYEFFSVITDCTCSATHFSWYKKSYTAGRDKYKSEKMLITQSPLGTVMTFRTVKSFGKCFTSVQKKIKITIFLIHSHPVGLGPFRWTLWKKGQHVLGQNRVSSIARSDTNDIFFTKSEWRDEEWIIECIIVLIVYMWQCC